MEVYCVDGTSFTCCGFEVNQFGLVAYGEEPESVSGRYEEDPDQIAFVPHDHLWYVLPSGVSSVSMADDGAERTAAADGRQGGVGARQSPRGVGSQQHAGSDVPAVGQQGRGRPAGATRAGRGTAHVEQGRGGSERRTGRAEQGTGHAGRAPGYSGGSTVAGRNARGDDRRR